ncbi:MAG: carboxypeptidase-like regulatory domain-containing protein [Planctomycetaceae bacterium]|jgi:hypothetical protein|nr:carboxypeptidase-like regulatory domain-containing protein [Planctomycetaceae bacterium]
MRRLFFTLLLFTVSIIGCDSGVQYLPVTGTLTVDGVPMEGVTLSFIPTSGGTTASATTNVQGEFVVTTSHHDGCIPGEYAVAVFKLEQNRLPAASSTSVGPPVGPPPVIKNLLPPKFSRTETSGLHATVESGMKPLTFNIITK